MLPGLALLSLLALGGLAGRLLAALVLALLRLALLSLLALGGLASRLLVAFVLALLGLTLLALLALGTLSGSLLARLRLAALGLPLLAVLLALLGLTAAAFVPAALSGAAAVLAALARRATLPLRTGSGLPAAGHALRGSQGHSGDQCSCAE
jgi:hypothetical protein